MKLNLSRVSISENSLPSKVINDSKFQNSTFIEYDESRTSFSQFGNRIYLTEISPLRDKIMVAELLLDSTNLSLTNQWQLNPLLDDGDEIIDSSVVSESPLFLVVVTKQADLLVVDVSLNGSIVFLHSVLYSSISRKSVVASRIISSGSLNTEIRIISSDGNVITVVIKREQPSIDCEYKNHSSNSSFSQNIFSRATYTSILGSSSNKIRLIYFIPCLDNPLVFATAIVTKFDVKYFLSLPPQTIDMFFDKSSEDADSIWKERDFTNSVIDLDNVENPLIRDSNLYQVSYLRDSFETILFPYSTRLQETSESFISLPDKIFGLISCKKFGKFSLYFINHQ